MTRQDTMTREETIKLTKRLINDLQFVLNDIHKNLESDSEVTQINAVLHANAILECVNNYPEKVKEIFEKLEKKYESI